MAVKSLKEQLSQIALKKVKLSNGETLAETMSKEAEKLCRCIQYYIDEYYNSYSPSIYDRTENYRHSLQVEDVADIRVVGNTLRISVYFDMNLAMHPNLESVYRCDKYGVEHWIPIADRHESFVPILMERGWSAPKLAGMIGKHVHRLTYFEGIRAVEQGINDYNRINKLGIKVNADNFYSSKAY